MTPRQKWIAALRSGKFKQTTGSLKDEEGYCCLGVACEVYQEEIGQGHWDGFVFVLPNDDDPEETEVGTFTCDGDLSMSPVKEWLGISNDEEQAFVRYNDDHGYSFEQIADKAEATA